MLKEGRSVKEGRKEGRKGSDGTLFKEDCLKEGGKKTEGRKEGRRTEGRKDI
jgi:hypothetical protein